MAMYRPTDLKAYLASLATHAKKVLSQNFIIDGNILRKIIAEANVTKDDVILEIGPGPGALTELLAETGAHLIAVEKDRIFADALQKRFAGNAHVKIYEDDILSFDFQAHFEQFFPKKVKVVANIPYHLTTPIIEKIINASSYIQTATLMVQEEMAARATALCGTRECSAFSLFLTYYTKAKYAFFVPRHCFYPEPNVDSAILYFALFKRRRVLDEEGFSRLIRTAFGKRRKMLRASLSSLYPKQYIEKALRLLNKDDTIRPEELQFEEWCQFFEIVSSFS